MGHAKSWKISVTDFSENNKARNTLNEWPFSHCFENNFSILGRVKHQKSPGKVWKIMNFIRSKENEPCIRLCTHCNYAFLGVSYRKGLSLERQSTGKEAMLLSAVDEEALTRSVELLSDRSS